MSVPTDNPSTWANAILAQLQSPTWHQLNLPACIDRVMVLAETNSTQDAAFRLAGGRPGLLVLAARQTAGRGRLSRIWADTSHLGVAATFVLDASGRSPEHLSLAAGLAAWRAIPIWYGKDQPVFKLRWPNDVVESRPPHRKIAGVLIEIKDELALVGIGINILQQDSDWPAELRDRAVSISQLSAAPINRGVIACLLVRTFADQLRATTQENARTWSNYDILLNTRRSFIHDNQTYTGLVQAIDPTNHIFLQLDDGTTKSLPALTTSLVHDA